MNSSKRLSETRLILSGAAVLLSLGMGIRQSFGLFLTPVTRDLVLTAADFTLAVAVQNIVWGLSQAPVGAIADRFGLRATMMAGCRDLRHRARRYGRCRRCHRADRLRRADRASAVLHSLLTRPDRCCAGGSRSAAEQGARRRCRGGVARHVPDPARNASAARASGLA